ncbi:hypothetical protein FHS27_002006 [Rhodopirellula rubra]|uniref:Uncharacterized protein n=1 Tax=Aporhodopirellula rubra TaxID=980271 RepID=A0A7W5H5F8_9BACT|nr:hypothetical protein [Aporhodopirellula rubra]MBB3206198.1 hypothetical protein [Aporhodopirellula rubra]
MRSASRAGNASIENNADDHPLRVPGECHAHESRSFIATVASLLCLITTTHLAAHEGRHHGDSHTRVQSRTWDSVADGLHLHGSFVSAKDGILS